MAVARAWRVTGLPATFVVRPGGEVVGMAVGMREWNAEPMRALRVPAWEEPSPRTRCGTRWHSICCNKVGAAKRSSSFLA